MADEANPNGGEADSAPPEPAQAIWVTREEALAGISLPAGGVLRLRLYDAAGLQRLELPEINTARGTLLDQTGAPVAGALVEVTLSDGRKLQVSTDSQGNFVANTGALKDPVQVRLV